MKNYILTRALIVIIAIINGCTTPVPERKAVHYIGSITDQRSSISIPDYNDSIKIMQITDIHIDIVKEEESEFAGYGERMHKAYMNPRRHYSQDISKSTTDYLADLLQKAKNENADLLLLTGDIVNFPSAASVQYVYSKLKEAGIEWLFISGNHDWHYEGMEGTPDSLRTTWIARSLMPLYNGLNPLFYSRIIHGINFVGIDNSTNIVNDEQKQFLLDQLNKPEPIILISHIPYNLNRGLNESGTNDITNIIMSGSSKIIAVITGHVHRTSLYFSGNLCQYTSLAGFQGASFMFDIRKQ